MINNKILFRCRHTYTYTCIHIHIYTYVYKCCCKFIFVSVSKAKSTYYKNNCPITVCLELCFSIAQGEVVGLRRSDFGCTGTLATKFSVFLSPPSGGFRTGLWTQWDHLKDMFRMLPHPLIVSSTGRAWAGLLEHVLMDLLRCCPTQSKHGTRD